MLVVCLKSVHGQTLKTVWNGRLTFLFVSPAFRVIFDTALYMNARRRHFVRRIPPVLDQIFYGHVKMYKTHYTTAFNVPGRTRVIESDVLQNARIPHTIFFYRRLLETRACFLFIFYFLVYDTIKLM